MSYASVAAHNAPPEDQQPHPDASLLERANPPAPSGEDYEGDKVHVVDQDEAEKLRHAIAHAEALESHVDDDFARARAHQQAREAEERQAQLKARAQAELKETTDEVAAVADGAKATGKQLEREAGKLYAEGKEEAKEKWAEGKQEAKELAGKVEHEAKKDAKKLQKKAAEVEKEGRALAKQYPYAASGLVGVVNLALVAVPAYFAYAHWNEPRWDRRIVSAVGVGLASIFGAESALGWWEYKQEKARK
ncbi:hypothetical protein JCM21900_002135 [Sporobolomyces salmonicolor]